MTSEAKVVNLPCLKGEEAIHSLFLWAEAELLEKDLPPGDQVLMSIIVEDILMEGL